MDNDKVKEIRSKVVYNVGLFNVPDIDVEDITQEVTLKIAKEIDLNRSIGEQNNFIYETTKNFIQNFTRDRVRQLDKEHQYYKYKKLNDHDRIEHPYSNEIRQDFENELETLPKQQRKVMKLTYQGYSNKEAAKELELNINQVKVYLHRARKKLQNKLEV